MPSSSSRSRLTPTALLAFASLVVAVVVARPSERAPSHQPVLKTLGQEIGSPSELAWQAWLLVESKGGISSALDSSNILRRITPKSIFIAPELVSCPAGYSTDGRGSCKPDPISIDEAAQKQFFLKRLNAIYGKYGANKKKPAPPQGPLQINIPISLPAKNPQPAGEPTPVLVSQRPASVANNETRDAVALLVYKVENETKKPEPFLLGSANSPSPPKKLAEVAVEASDTFGGVVDYEIPVQPPANLTTDVAQQKVGDDQSSSEDSSPRVVLLLSPARLPSYGEKPKVTEATSTEVPGDVKTTEAITLPTTVDEATLETTQTAGPLDLETDVDTTIRTTGSPFVTSNRDDYERRDQQMSTTTFAPSTMEDETAYTDEDETEESQTPGQGSEEEEEEEEEEYEDEFVEDELLKPGEAGMLMSAKNQELIRSKTHATSTIPATTTTTTTMQQDTTTIPPTVDVYDAKESTIKAEVTVFTTQTTDAPSTVPIVSDETTATVVTPRPQRVKATIQINQYAAETRRQAIVTTENPSEPPSSFPQRQPQRKPPPSFTVNDEPIFFKDGRRDNLPSEFKDQLPPRTYVRFPESPKPPRGYVRFPSDDLNSIHTHQDGLKDLSPFQYSSSTKGSVQRWRQHQKQPKPMLLRFWARMPLVRDLTFYPTTSHGSHNEPIGGPTQRPPASRRGAATFKNEA